MDLDIPRFSSFSSLGSKRRGVKLLPACFLWLFRIRQLINTKEQLLQFKTPSSSLLIPHSHAFRKHKSNKRFVFGNSNKVSQISQTCERNLPRLFIVPSITSCPAWCRATTGWFNYEGEGVGALWTLSHIVVSPSPLLNYYCCCD